MRSMKKLIGLLLIAVIVFGTLGVAYGETVSPMYAAVNDVQAMLEIESDGTANALVFVAPKQKGVCLETPTVHMIWPLRLSLLLELFRA